MDGSCPAVAGTCPTASAIFFTGLISTLLKSEREIGSAEYPLDASQYLRSEYDFIVVGGGTVGSVVAARLSEVPDWNVLLIEAGGDPPLISNIPAVFFGLQKTEIDWSFRTEPQEHGCLGFRGKQCIWPRGKALGGSSILNGMLYIRGLKEDFDRWEQLGNKGWSSEEVLEYFKKSENFHPDDIETESSAKYHGTGGPIHIQRFQNLDIAHTLMAAIKEKGLTQLDDINGPNHNGFAYLHGTMINGTRCSTARGFLGEAKDRSNLHVIKHSHVTKIVIDPETKEAKSVKFISKDGKTHQVNVKREVVVSAGTVNSPQVLMLSGIGPEEHLKKLGIKPVKNLKVGENLQEHLVFLGSLYTIKKSDQVPSDESSLLDASYEYLRHRTGYFSTHYGTTVTGFLKTKLEPEEPRPDIELFTFVIPANQPEAADGLGSAFGMDDNAVASLKELTKEGSVVFFAPALCRPKTRGQILLRSKNPLEHPIINPKFLSDHRDVETLIEGTKLVAELMKTGAMKKVDVKRQKLDVPGCDSFEYDSRGYWECMIRHVASSCFHAVGSCKMGPSSDPDAVVDPQLKVHGVKGIRVADISIMPNIVSGPTVATAMMIGEKAADMIKQEWLNEQ